MARDRAPSDRDQPADRVDRLDPKTIRLVVFFPAMRIEHRPSEADCERAWECFYRACDPLFRKLANRRCRKCWGLEDRVQELWRVILGRLRTYDPERGSFPIWLAAVVRNALNDQDRASHVLGHLNDESEHRLPSREAGPAIVCEQADVRVMVGSAAKELRSIVPEMTYEIIHARWVEGKTYAEIAAALGLTVKQVRDRNHRAMGDLRAILIRRR